jgi:tetraacyldisaccharide 4'-kinase
VSSLPDWLQRRWYGDTPPGLVLSGLATLYAALVALRRLGFHRRWFRAHRVSAPVIVIGNLTVGGTGKTPMTIALVEWLQQRGWTPGVVSRGYGRRSRQLVRVGPATLPAEAGDEPCLVAARTGAVVVVDSDRVAAAEAALAAGADIIVSDDGLQHYRLARDLEIEMIDGSRGYGNRRMLPAGPLREPLERALQCDAHVVNGGDADAEGKWAMRLVPQPLQALHDTGEAERQPRPLSAFAGQRVHAVAGIGEPARFFTTLREAGIELIEHPFPDHHDYRTADFAFGDGLPVLMTEKDAVKARHLALVDAPLWVLPVGAELPGAFFAMLAGQLTRFQAGRAGIDLF